MPKKKTTGAHCPVHSHMGSHSKCGPSCKPGHNHGPGHAHGHAHRPGFPSKCLHSVQPVVIGGKTVYAGGAMHMKAQDIMALHESVAMAAVLEAAGAQTPSPTSLLVVPLTEARMPLPFGVRFNVLSAPLHDFGGVPAAWGPFVSQLADEVKDNVCILGYCDGGHGRTGTLLASLIAVLEPQTEDPIAAVRERYCRHAVETSEQGAAIFALRGKPLPEKYHGTFMCDMFKQRAVLKANAEPIIIDTAFGEVPPQKK